LKEAYISLLDETVSEVVLLDEERVIVETMNEPTSACNDGRWQQIQVEIYSHLRKRFGDGLKIAVTGSCFSNPQSLPFVDMSAFAPMKNTYVTFHYYRPYWFTHQGASWGGGPGQKYLTGVQWPSRLGDVQTTMTEIRQFAPQNPFYKLYGERGISEAEGFVKNYYNWKPDEPMLSSDIDGVGQWADAKGVPRSHIILGEFGVLKKERSWRGADIDSAARWTEAVRTDAEKNGFAWSLWAYKGGMALAVSDDGIDYYPELVRALGLKP